jgi:hypothetical protein
MIVDTHAHLVPPELLAAAGIDGATAARINGGLASELFRLR